MRRLAILFSCAFAALAQSPPTAGISGHALAPDGRPLLAILTLQSTTAPPPSLQRAFTDVHGNFQFHSLAAGTYSLCASPLPNQGKSPQELFVDSCLWGPALTLRLSAGQALTAVSLPIASGALFQVHVNDPDHVLPQSGPNPTPLNPNPGDSQLIVALQSPDHLLHHIPITGRTTSGRDHYLIVPSQMALSLAVHAPKLTVSDSSGSALAAAVPLPSASAATTPAPVQVTVHGGKQ